LHSRYPEDLQRALSNYPESLVREYLNQTIEALEWLKKHPRLNE